MAETNENTRGASLSEVTAAILQPAPTSKETAQVDEASTEKELPVDDTTDEVSEDEIEEIEEGSEEDTPDEDDEDEDGERFRVTVDGEETEVTLAELTANYQIRSAAQKRLNEATQMRKIAEEEGFQKGMETAKVEITRQSETISSANQALQTVLQAVGAEMFSPRVSPPDPSMRETDPIGYFAQKDDYDNEVQRIKGLEQTVGQFMTNLSQQTEQQQKQHRQEQGRLLRQEREDLRSEEGQKLFTARVRAAQNALGFTQAEVDAYPDRRGLIALELAGKYLESQGAINLDSPQSKVVQKAKKVLRPGAQVAVRTGKQKQRRADRERAAKTGDYRDVAKLLIK